MPFDTINLMLENYDNTLEAKRVILEKEKIKEAIIAQKQKDLNLTKYQISRYIKSINRRLYWDKYTRVISGLESSHRYDITNQYGYLGKYQISNKYINNLGYSGTQEEFLKDKLGQEMVMANYTYRNLKYIRKNNLDKYIGKEINGIKVTLFGIMASAHLVGVKSVTEYLNSNGETIHKDGNDTSLEKYLKAFAQS